jgi:4-alpha-glucanotransferase
VVVPGDLPVGHHLLTVDFEVSGATAPLVVAPPVLPGAPAAVRWGLGGATGQVRATASGGPADLDDLAEVVSWAGADLGADFVVSPTVHGGAVPFAPAALVRPERVPEHAALDDRTRGLLATGPRSTALRTLYAAPRSPRRQRAFEAFCVAGGQALLDHATWLTIASRHGEDVAAWPRPLRASGGDAVARLREDAADEVNFHRWCQWVADEQLTEAVREARRTGMRLGLVSPVSPPGAVDAGQAWSLGCAPARGVRLGRPPGAGDPHGAVGDQRPWAPTTLRDLALEPLRRHLDAVTRRADGLLLTLPERWLRQWWVPEGAPAAEGAWVEQDHDALLAAVAVAAHRSGAVVLADVRGLAAREAEWLLAQGVVPVVEGGAGAGTARGALRWVDIGTLAEEAPGPLVLDRLAGSPSVRRRARSLAR